MAGAEARWRIVVQIGAGQPELHAALVELPARARAERLRQLALLGLCSLGKSPAIAPGEVARESDSGVTARRERLLRGLLGESD